MRYLGLVDQLKQLVVDPMHALSAAVYTELTDVEAEINGLMTYDRKVSLLHFIAWCYTECICPVRTQLIGLDAGNPALLHVSCVALRAHASVDLILCSDADSQSKLGYRYLIALKASQKLYTAARL